VPDVLHISGDHDEWGFGFWVEEDGPLIWETNEWVQQKMAKGRNYVELEWNEFEWELGNNEELGCHCFCV
jgi:hypothetical protein